ncbi:MAG: hypothetical protein CMM32_07725 [Rhodospirillaceae bacterium]|nr:hypothetical protein [Rhodospirillaceae bacterium]
MMISIKQLHSSLGAEVGGVDLSMPLVPGVKQEIDAAWRQHGVLVFRNQDITDVEHVRFSRCFGELEVLPETERTDSSLPEIFILSNVGSTGEILPETNDAVVFNSLTWAWHTDSCYRMVPSKGAILHGIEVVQGGGARQGLPIYGELLRKCRMHFEIEWKVFRLNIAGRGCVRIVICQK